MRDGTCSDMGIWSGEVKRMGCLNADRLPYHLDVGRLAPASPLAPLCRVLLLLY